jgi:hypothetical protein
MIQGEVEHEGDVFFIARGHHDHVREDTHIR